ncbi:MAG: TonB-dependent receptor [Gemmatimonadota bacterium]|nr:TonB-dependent receptor [Gemmatimonadota bacterium]
MKRTLLLSTLILLGGISLPHDAMAQTGTITGRVTSQDGSAIAGAQVSVTGTGMGTLSNARGAFLILNVPAGSHTVQVQSIGYETVEATVSVTAGGTATHSFRLGESAVAIADVSVTVGSRMAHTAADELAVPVDVYTQAEIIQASPQMEMGTILQELSPAIYMPRPQIADLTSGVRPFQLRGMSPDHSLVLINGKRRHPTAVIHVFGAASGGSGSSGVDMNAIVPSAIGGMEILRDGAAAQYGSDAIAGVINMQLRSDIHAPEFGVTVGQYRPSDFDPDGRRVEMSGSYGMALGGDRGTLVVSGMYSDRERTHRAGPDPRDQVVPGDADIIQDIDGDGVGEIVTKNNAVDQPNHLIGDGLANNGGGFWNASYELGEDRIHQVYAFGGYTFRRDIHSGYFRRSLDSRNWPEIFPLGFLPKFRGDAQDFMSVMGVRGYAGEWNYDVSTQWGRNRLDTDIFDTHNVSLGPCLVTACAPGPDGIFGNGDDPGIPNKTDVYAGAMTLNQGIGQIDFSRGVEIGVHSPLSVAAGAALRYDSYEIIEGEPASYVNGGHLSQTGGTAAVGSQVFTGYRPDQSGTWTRTNIGMYLDLETELSETFLIAGAARLERYSDFGTTLTGKLAMRLKPSEQLVLRAAASTGFRAPALNQSHYSHVSTGFRNDGSGNQVAYEIGEIPVESPEARALGAESLTEEKSRNLSGGFAFSPTEQLTFTVDAYQIDVDDRIILTGSLSGDTVAALLAAYGAPTVKFFTNAVDTRTRGMDVTGRYRHILTSGRYVEFLAQYNRNTLEVVGVHPPGVLTEIQDQVFTSDDQYTIENGRPKDRATLRTRVVDGAVTVALAGNYYGVQSYRLEEGAGTSPDVFQENGPHLVWDLDATYEFNDRLSLSVGAENILDRNPPARPDGYNFLGIFPFYSSSGLNMNGRYVYTRLNVHF